MYPHTPLCPYIYHYTPIPLYHHTPRYSIRTPAWVTASGFESYLSYHLSRFKFIYSRGHENALEIAELQTSTCQFKAFQCKQTAQPHLPDTAGSSPTRYFIQCNTPNREPFKNHTKETNAKKFYALPKAMWLLFGSISEVQTTLFGTLDPLSASPATGEFPYFLT